MEFKKPIYPIEQWNITETEFHCSIGNIGFLNSIISDRTMEYHGDGIRKRK